jgi:hypothetical protein
MDPVAFLNSIPLVTTGLALVAFVVLAGLFAYRSSLDQQAKEIEALPDGDRAKAIRQKWGVMFDTQLPNLPVEDQTRLVGDQIRNRFQIQTRWIYLIGGVAVLLTIIAVVGMMNRPPTPESPMAAAIKTLSTADAPQTEVLLALATLAGAGASADAQGVCVAIENYLRGHAVQGTAPPPSTLRIDVQKSVEALSTLRQAQGCKSSDLRGIDLRRLILPAGRLDDARLTGSWLNDANLAGAYLINAEMTGVDLTEAVLHDSKLKGATLAAAVVTGANFKDATDACLKKAEHLDEAIGVSEEAKQC